MKAMIFAAGMGTRLKPLTNKRPKALVEIKGKSMLERCTERLISAGVKTIIINIHHFPELMTQAIKEFDYPGVDIYISDEREELLDTGGGLQKAERILDGHEPFVIHNVDIISDIDIEKMYRHHLEQDALVSLAVSKRTTTRYFLWHKKRLCGWRNIQTHNEIKCYPVPETPVEMAFSGIHIVSPRIFRLMTETGRFSLNQVYLRLAYQHKIVSFEHDPALWADLGSTEKIAAAQDLIED